MSRFSCTPAPGCITIILMKADTPAQEQSGHTVPNEHTSRFRTLPNLLCAGRRVQYCQAVRRTWTIRALVVFLCVALVLALALGFAGSHTSWAVVAPFLSLFLFPASGARFSCTPRVRCQPVPYLS